MRFTNMSHSFSVAKSNDLLGQVYSVYRNTSVEVRRMSRREKNSTIDCVSVYISFFSSDFFIVQYLELELFCLTASHLFPRWFFISSFNIPVFAPCQRKYALSSFIYFWHTDVFQVVETYFLALSLLKIISRSERHFLFLTNSILHDK